MDRGAWRAIAHGVAKSQTRLSTHVNTHTNTHTHIPNRKLYATSQQHKLFNWCSTHKNILSYFFLFLQVLCWLLAFLTVVTSSGSDSLYVGDRYLLSALLDSEVSYTSHGYICSMLLDPSCGRILKLVWLFWVLKHIRQSVESFSFVFLKLVWRLKFWLLPGLQITLTLHVSSAWPSDKARAHCHCWEQAQGAGPIEGVCLRPGDLWECLGARWAGPCGLTHCCLTDSSLRVGFFTDSERQLVGPMSL